MNQPPSNPNSFNITIIPIPKPLLNLLLPSLRPEKINITHRPRSHKINPPTFTTIQRTLRQSLHGTKLNQLHIPQHPQIKPTNLVRHINNSSTAPRSEI